MFLIIKGSLAQAIAAAQAHGIELIGESEAVQNSIYCHCDASHSLAVTQWFCEPNNCEAGNGYSAGVLLFYR